MDLTVDVEAPPRHRFEVAEHKGRGHPDTICDALAEASTLALSRAYLERFDRVLHHNVDKALLVGGVARPRLGGGEVVVPIEIDLAGRVTDRVGDQAVATADIVRSACDRWLRGAFHALDVDRHVVLRTRLRTGSDELRGIFDATTACANDTSCGAAYAPATLLDRVVLAVGERLRRASTAPGTAWVGEDVKVMGVRRDRHLDLTVACAVVDRHVRDVAAYRDAIGALEAMAREAATEVVARAPTESIDRLELRVNGADDLARGQLYLTVTGTSAEGGDDGEVGRGNRVNGLITPGRAMTLEAAAGKNAFSHVGKLYSVAARVLAERVVALGAPIVSADAMLVSRIARPVDDPLFAHLRVRTVDGHLDDRLRAALEVEVRVVAAEMPQISTRLLAGQLSVLEGL